MNELYWVANYSDGSKFEKFNSEGKERRYEEIDRDRLVRFDLLEVGTNHPVYSLYIREGQRLIYRRRTLVTITGGVEKNRVIIYLVGYQQTIMTPSGPRTIVVLNYIHEDGSISLDGARNNLELLDFEK